ncbi:MAG: GFA family protein [Steroidobacteraceae bacterium]
MTSNSAYPLGGGCDCRLIRYRLETAPLIVHCCHCRWCQRETGTAFALNAVIEAERVVHVKSEPELIDTPSRSGSGQKIARCPSCRVAVWSNYAGAGPILRFVRVGTLDEPDLLPPDIHIYMASKQPWVVLPPGVPAVPEFYEIERQWSADSLTRRAALMPRLKAYRAALAG